MNDVVNVRLYDFGPDMPVGITLVNAVTRILSAQIGLPASADFATELEHLYTQTLRTGFTTALEFLSGIDRYKKLLLDMRYAEYAGPNMGVGAVYADTVRRVSSKIHESMPVVYNPDTLYNAFLAASIMTTLLRAGKDDCSKYIGLVPASIIDVYGEIKASSENIDKDTVLMLYTRGMLDNVVLQVLQHPNSAANIVRKHYFRAYAQALENIKRQSIFSTFFETLVKQKYPDLASKGTAIAEQIHSLDLATQHSLVDRVYRLYTLGLIVSRVDIDIPTEDAIKQVEAFALPAATPAAKPVTVALNVAGTMLDFTAHAPTLYINELHFPTISHYVYYLLKNRQYSAVYDGKNFIPTPDISDKYIIVPDMYESFHRALFSNEIYGIGPKITDDLANDTVEVDTSLPDRLVVVVTAMCADTSRLLKENKDVLASKPVIPAALRWVVARMDQMYAVYDKLQFNHTNMTPEQRQSLYMLFIGPCATTDVVSGDLFLQIKSKLYTTMRDVLKMSPHILPDTVVQYARRTLSLPDTKDKIPRAIRFPVLAIKNIINILSPSIVSRDNAAGIAIYILSGHTPTSEIRNDYTTLVSSELGISNDAAAKVLGFVSSIGLDSDEIHRRIIFYSVY